MPWVVAASSRLYGIVVRLCYPAWFRARHGSGLNELFADRCALTYRSGGTAAVMRSWPAALRDAIVNGAALRWQRTAAPITAPPVARFSSSSTTSSRGILGMPETLLRDLRFAVKMLLREPAVAGVTVVTLAIGIAATIAMFTVVNGVVLQPLPFPESHRIVHLLGDQGRGRWAISFPDYVDAVQQSDLFQSTAAWQGWGVTLADDEGIPRIYNGASVSGGFFDVLGVQPALGRFFTAAEDRAGHEPVVVIGFGLWQSRFGGRRDVLGEALFDDGSFTIVGVAPAGFVDPVARSIWGSTPSVWRSRPDSFDPATAARDWLGFWAVGRLSDGVSLEQAGERIGEIGSRLARDYPETNEGRGLHLATLKDLAVGDARSTALLMLGAVGLLLLIACANVANLLMSRGAGRRREIAVRTALGATRGRLVRQLFVESIVLALAASVLGLAAAAAAVPFLIELAGDGLPRADAIRVDATVVGFSLLATLTTALLFGTAPALQISELGSARALREGTRGASGSGHAARLRHGFVIGQTAMAVMLLIAAGLLGKSLWRLSTVDLGVDTTSVLAARVAFGSQRYPALAEQSAGIDGVVERLAGLPGVEEVAAISNRPMSGTFDSTSVSRDDLPLPEPGEAVRPLVRAITPTYFAAMRMPVLRGRGFTARDRDPANQVAVIDEEAARQLFGDEDPIGGRVTVRGDSREIVGVVGNVRNFGPAGDLLPVLYQPVAQTHQSWILANMTFMLRNRRHDAELAEVVRRSVSEVDATLPVANVAWMDAVVADEVAAPRFRSTLVLIFAATATLLAGIGLAGVIAYSVSSQRREIAVRMALGARPRRVLAGVMTEAAWLSAWGIGLGVAAAWFAARIVASMLFEVAPTDLAVFTAVPLLLSAVGLAAALVPAGKATRVDPASILRS